MLHLLTVCGISEHSFWGLFGPFFFVFSFEKQRYLELVEKYGFKTSPESEKSNRFTSWLTLQSQAVEELWVDVPPSAIALEK